MAGRRRKYTKQPHLWCRKESKTWYIVFRNGDKLVRICTKTRDYDEANDKLLRFLKEEYLEEPVTPPEQAVTLHQGITAWLENCERPRRGLRHSTLVLYRGLAIRLQEAFPEDPFARDVTRKDIREFLNQQEDAGVGLGVIKRRLLGLKMVFNFLLEEEVVPVNPCSRFKVYAPSTRYSAMPESTYFQMSARMRQEIEASKTPEKRSEASDLLDLTEVIWHSGLRFVETTRLTWSDINFLASIWTIRSPRNKGGVKTIPFRQEIRAVLFKRFQMGAAEGPFFHQYGYYQRLWKSFRRRNPDFLSWKFHCLRHSFISRLRCQGSDAAAMLLARHSSSSMSDRYTHMDMDHMRKELGAI